MYCTLVREQYMPFLFIVLLRGNSVVFFRFALSRQTLPHKRSGIANGGVMMTPHFYKSSKGDEKDWGEGERAISEDAASQVTSCMQTVVSEGTGVGGAVDGYDVAGKTGTAENPRGRDHSTFLSFAPKDNPKIAISVYVENGGFGASAALPIASLLEEYYLTDTIRRPALLDYVRNMTINYPAYDR